MSLLINSYAYATGGGGEDVTPDTLDASYIAQNNYFEDFHQNAYFRITGVTSNITLKASYGSNSVYYKVVGSNPAGVEESENPTTGGWTFIGNTGTFSVSNDQWVVIGGDCGSGTAEWDVQILNNSSSDTLLTTVSIIASYTPV